MPLTPMMQKYMETKEQYKDCILFYRLGDFYEMFFDDALTASKELEITLTGKNCGLEERTPMCGIPYHAVDSYLNRLVSKGYKVAICEQVEDPKTITLVCSALYDLTQEYDIIALFFDCNTIVVDIADLAFQFGKLMIMGGK